MVPVNIVAATPAVSQDHDSGWNCQDFPLEGLQDIPCEPEVSDTFNQESLRINPTRIYSWS